MKRTTEMSICAELYKYILIDQIPDVTVRFHCVLNKIQKIFPRDGEEKCKKCTVGTH